MAVAVDRIRAAIAAGKRICVHGDYDVDGICATALAVLTLRKLGADVEWHLPSRFEEGYGVSDVTISRLADEGCSLLLTVDCGITAVEEVAAAKARGLEVIVTDHHRPGPTLPECPVVATRPSDYPFPELCGTGVVCKLAQALGVDVAPYLDLVALATIADVVPLLDENRSLAIAGLRALARTQRPGLQALMRNARVDPAAVDAGAVGFRLAPRINAAGRLGRPDAALELLLTTDKDEAQRLAGRARDAEPGPAGGREPHPPRGDRRGRVVARAEAAPARLRDLGRGLARGRDRDRRLTARRALQPPGRPDRRHRRQGEWKGSGRSLPAFDLHGALAACSAHLHRFGGHRAAAGLSIVPENLEAFAAAFAAHADAQLADDDLAPVTRIDAIVPGSALTLGLASELERLAPFGLGNPDVTLLVPSCEAVQPGVVGEGKHLRFRIRQGGRDAGSAIAFGMGAQLDRIATAGSLRPRVPAEGEPLERHDRAAARDPAPLRRARRLRGAAGEPGRALAGRRGRVDERRPRDLRGAPAGRRRPQAALRVGGVQGVAGRNRARAAARRLAGGAQRLRLRRGARHRRSVSRAQAGARASALCARGACRRKSLRGDTEGIVLGYNEDSCGGVSLADRPEYTECMAVVDVDRHHQDLVDELIAAVEEYNPGVDKELLARAFRFAATAHAGQMRSSGEPFVHHPWAVAKICAELHLDEQSLAAALLHDVVEDTETEPEAVRDEFGDEIAQLVEGVTS